MEKRTLELVVAVVVLAGLAGVTRLSGGPAPDPLSPQARWSIQAAPAVASLARDVASAGNAPGSSPGWSRAWLPKLKADLRRAEAAGTPPDPARAAVWDRALRRVGAAISQAGADPAAARPDLRTAGLELTQLDSVGGGAEGADWGRGAGPSGGAGGAGGA
ncbi:MAG TPA: hypothetical protein VFH45_09980 [Acidimicrobiales bacterium]|nr:hypothetical protein [Acidimicrobiales bacterium]